MSRLRRFLTPDRAAHSPTELIRSRGDGYQLVVDGHEIDAARFERLAGQGRRLLEADDPSGADEVLGEALGLWRGAAYQEFRYARFGSSEGERLEELRREALEDRVDAQLAKGEAGSLISDLDRMVEEEPLRERRWGQLMLALYRSGRQAEALQAFIRARSVLVDELGIEPGPDLQRLHASILAQDPALERPQLERSSAQARSVDVCPYKGLARFEADDAEFFFGREQVVAEAVGHLVGGRFLALVGASGSGKSSLLRAGVLHALRSGAVPGSDRWAYAIIRPGAHPLQELQRATEELADAHRALLAIDQFEEIFTACDDDAERRSFLDALTGTVLRPEATVTVVIAMRVDFYGRCARHRAFASLLETDQILLGPMDADELRRAIVSPAQRAGLVAEEGLVEALVGDTLDRPGALPLLSTALLELWTERRDRTLSLDGYLRSGGVEGAVARLAEDAYGRLGHEEQAAAKRILLRLADAREGSETVRRRVQIEEFDLRRDPSASSAMAALADARLVTFSDGTVEVSHEALLHEWPRLRTWLEDDAEGRKVHRHVTGSSRTWDEGGRDAADLYRGARLAAALEWAGAHGQDLNDLERSFLSASRAASEDEAGHARKTNRRLRGLLVGLAILLCASLVIGDLALTQRDQARRALSVGDAGRLASRSLVEADPALALIMAREAVDIDDSVETRSALFAALERAPAVAARFQAPGGRPPAGDETRWIEIAPDGSTLAVGGTGSRVEFFDADTHEYEGRVGVGSATEHAAFSPSGATLVVATADRELRSVDVATRSVGDHVVVRGSVDAIAFSPDGTELITAENVGAHEYLVLRDARTLASTGPGRVTPGDQDHRGLLPLSPYFSVAFAPDGGSLVTTSSLGPTVLWDVRTLEEERVFQIAGAGVAVSPDGSVAAIIVNDDQRTEGDVSLIDLRTGQIRAGSGGHNGSSPTTYEATGVAFSPDGRSVATVGNDSRLLVWDVDTVTVRATLDGATGIPLEGPVISRDGSTAFTTDGTGVIVEWDLSGDRRLGRPFSTGSGLQYWPFFALSPDGRTLAVLDAVPGSAGTTIELIDTADLDTVGRITYARPSPVGLVFTDPSTLVVSSWTQGDDASRGRSSIRAWDIASSEPTSSVLSGVPRGTELWALAAGPDGTTVVAGGPEYAHPHGVATGKGRVIVWDLAEPGRPVASFETPVGKPIWNLNVTPDGSGLIGAAGFIDGALFRWDIGTGAVEWTKHSTDGGVSASDVSNDGTTVVTGAQDGTVRLWDARSGEPLGKPLTGLQQSADTVDLSPDDSMVVGADSNGTVLLWDVSSGTLIGDPLPGPEGEALAAAFAPDGRSVVVVSDRGSAWLWDVAPDDWEARACELAGRSLTPQEWQQLLPGRPYHATCGP